MQDPARLMPLLVGKMRVSGEMFYVPRHVVIWDAVVAMWREHRPIDLLTVCDWLQARGKLEGVGGASVLDGLVDATPTAAHGEYYAEQVRQKFMCRRIVEVGRDAAEACGMGTAPQEVVAEMMSRLLTIGSEVMQEARSNVEVLDGLVANWERARDMRQQGLEAMPGLRTPFRRLNEVLGGFQPGLHLVGGKSSAGKTTLVGNICKTFLADGHPGLVIQLDDTHEDVVGRMVSSLAGASLPALSQGFGKGDVLAKIKGPIRDAIGAMPLYVVEECADMREATALTQYYQARHGIKWLVIDYVQVMDADGNVRDDERIRLGKIATACKRLWKRQRIPVIAVSQTSRFKDSEDDGMRADMSDLYGASELFHHATTVLIAKAVREKPEPKGKLEPIELAIDETGHTKKAAVALHVVKNKHGAKDCQVLLWLLAKYFQFSETRWTHVAGIDRQMTWQEEIGAGPAGGTTTTFEGARGDVEAPGDSEEPEWMK